MNFTRWLSRLICTTCEHQVYIDDIRRASPEKVYAPCNRCGKVLSAPYGIALKATLMRRPNT